MKSLLALLLLVSPSFFAKEPALVVVVESFAILSKNTARPTDARFASSATTTTTTTMEAPEPAVFNFGAASSRDQVLFTAERPGNPTIAKTTGGLADPEQVRAWMNFMTREQGIRNVIALLDENEFAVYGDEGHLLRLYREAGMQCLVQPMRGNNACRNIVEFVRRAEAADEKVVAHCTGGVGRAGRVAACWLMKR